MQRITEEALTINELAKINEVKADCKKHTDLILKNNYTGTINEPHVNDIHSSLMVSFVSRRLLYMKEFLEGLNKYGLGELLCLNMGIGSKLSWKESRLRNSPPPPPPPQIWSKTIEKVA